ncbi:MAG: bacillithiol biosynthesis cysteine-adding enzyme BshC [Cytophagaceae bacterium]|nr:bacillithiol biosynthesis cysteine-adding enzyme BshC [Cytophagaceae bacterium]
MPVQSLPFDATRQFSKLFLDYIAQKPDLKPFYDGFPDLEGFRHRLSLKTFDAAKRRTLVDVLQRQYAGLPNPPDFQVLLDEKTFTVTTGHQLNLCTGPLYVAYKLLTVNNLAKKLAAHFPDYRFVPVYWMASEDHDFAEINHVSLSGKTYTWETEQTGAVGRMTTQELGELFAVIPEKLEVFERCYAQQPTLASAVRAYLHELFGAEGLVCLDADDRDLKAQFADVMRDDVRYHNTYRLVGETTKRLESLGYKSQITPREINFFYLANGLRERLIPTHDGYEVLDTGLRFLPEELDELIADEPEHLSPNVILRPLYQEVILPNLAYIGGPSEVPYWLQLKGVFDYYQVPFPLLMPRNFALVLNPSTARRVQNLNLSAEDLFKEEAALRKSFVKRHAEHDLEVDGETARFDQLFTHLYNKAIAIDPTLGGAVRADRQRLFNRLEWLEKRLIRAEARQQEIGLRHLAELKAHLFPDGSAQERVENLMNFLLPYPDFLQKMAAVFDPLDYRFYVVELD